MVIITSSSEPLKGWLCAMSCMWYKKSNRWDAVYEPKKQEWLPTWTTLRSLPYRTELLLKGSCRWLWLATLPWPCTGWSQWLGFVARITVGDKDGNKCYSQKSSVLWFLVVDNYRCNQPIKPSSAVVDAQTGLVLVDPSRGCPWGKHATKKWTEAVTFRSPYGRRPPNHHFLIIFRNKPSVFWVLYLEEPPFSSSLTILVAYYPPFLY